MANSQTKGKNPLNLSTLIGLVLSYERYLRLMALLFLLGVIAGLSVYIFKKGQYTSRSVYRINGYVDTSAAISGGRATVVNYRAVRVILGQLGSRNFQLQAARNLGVVGSESSWEDLRAYVLPGYRVSLLDESHFQLDVYSYYPQVAERLPDAVIDTFYDWRREQRLDYREQAVARYMNELEEVRAKMNEQLDQRLEYEEESAIAQVRVELDNLSSLPVELIRVQHTLAEMDRTKSILAQWGEELDVVGRLALLDAVPVYDGPEDSSVGRVLRASERPGVPVSPTVNPPTSQIVIRPDMVEGLKKWEELEREKRRLEEKLLREEDRFLEDHPVIVELKSELSEVERGLELELEVAEKAFDVEFIRLREELENIENSLPEYHKATRAFDETSQEFDIIAAGGMAWKQAYAALKAEVERLDFSVDREVVDIQSLGFTRLEVDSPVSPSKKGVAMQGLALGFGLAFGVPFMLIRLSSTVTSLDTTERVTGVKGLGILALASQDHLDPAQRKDSSAGDRNLGVLQEAFRLIRTQVLLDSDVENQQVIVVTSAKPGEGKTTVSSNLASSFASMGQKTLLVDCDLRRGRLHSVLGVENGPGIAEFFHNSASGDSLIKSTQIPDLYAVTRGGGGGAIADSLNSESFTRLIESFRGQFERIVVDSPPMLGLSDTALIQSFADGVLFVVKYDSTLLQDVITCVDELKKLDSHIFGFVLNQVNFSELRNSYGYYQYSSYYYQDVIGTSEERNRQQG